MSRAVLDTDALRRFSSPAGADDGVVQALRKKQYFRTISGVAAIRDTLANDFPELALRTGFSEAFAYVSGLSPALQRKLLGYPTIVFWVEVALDLLRRRAHLKFPELHIETHLESFGRSGLAAALLSEGSFSCKIRTDGAGGVFLPGADCYCSLVDAQPFERIRFEIRDGRPRALQLGHDREYAVTRREVPRIGALQINVLDEDLRLPGRHDFQFDLPFRDADILRWSSPLEESQRWILESNPHLASEIDTAVKAIVPVRSKSAEVHVSATFREAPGLVALSWTPDTPVLAEALVHEYHHGKLNTLLAADPLIAGPTEEAVFYSPWRPDPRPLVGILHGAFVFHAVLEFWITFLAAGIPILHETRLRQRLCLVSRQTRDALETLVAQADLSQCGLILVRHLLDNTNRLDPEVSGDSRVLQRVERLMASHREQWRQQHGTLTARPRVTGSSTYPESSILSQRAARPLSVDKLAEQFPAVDPVIEDLAVASDAGHLASALNDWVRVSQVSSAPSLEMLARAHAAYIAGTFDEAGARYGALTQRYPSSRYFWQCFAHCLRHLGQIDLGTGILTHLGKLSTEARPESGNMEMAFGERAEHAANLLAQSLPG